MAHVSAAQYPTTASSMSYEMGQPYDLAQPMEQDQAQEAEAGQQLDATQQLAQLERNIAHWSEQRAQTGEALVATATAAYQAVSAKLGTASTGIAVPVRDSFSLPGHMHAWSRM